MCNRVRTLFGVGALVLCAALVVAVGAFGAPGMNGPPGTPIPASPIHGTMPFGDPTDVYAIHLNEGDLIQAANNSQDTLTDGRVDPWIPTTPHIWMPNAYGQTLVPNAWMPSEETSLPIEYRVPQGAEGTYTVEVLGLLDDSWWSSVAYVLNYSVNAAPAKPANLAATTDAQAGFSEDESIDQQIPISISWTKPAGAASTIVFRVSGSGETVDPTAYDLANGWLANPGDPANPGAVTVVYRGSASSCMTTAESWGESYHYCAVSVSPAGGVSTASTVDITLPEAIPDSEFAVPGIAYDGALNGAMAESVIAPGRSTRVYRVRLNAGQVFFARLEEQLLLGSDSQYGVLTAKLLPPGSANNGDPACAVGVRPKESPYGINRMIDVRHIAQTTGWYFLVVTRVSGPDDFRSRLFVGTPQRAPSLTASKVGRKRYPGGKGWTATGKTSPVVRLGPGERPHGVLVQVNVKGKWKSIGYQFGVFINSSGKWPDGGKLKSVGLKKYPVKFRFSTVAYGLYPAAVSKTYVVR
jgi:hypothetical protein